MRPLATAVTKKESLRASVWRSCKAQANIPQIAVHLPSQPAAKAARVTALYLGALGIALFLWPRKVFSLFFDARELSASWIRVFGALCSLLAWYYHGASLGRPDGFLRATVSGRLALALVLVWIVAFGGGAPGLLLLAGTNTFGAITMRRALKASSARPPVLLSAPS